VPLKGVEGEVNIYRLVKWLGPIEAAPNPFIWRGGITKAADFFDRDNEQRTLRDFLRGRQNCQIVGPRRISKTSLLRQIERKAAEWEPAAVVAFIDLMDARCSTLIGWLHRVSRRFGWEQRVTTLGEFTDGIEAMVTAGKHPVLCLDEFEEFTTRRAEFTREFFANLRFCGQNGMSVITASQQPLSDLTERGDPSSPFYNIFRRLQLGPFAEADANDFVTIYRPGIAPFNDEEKKMILDFAKGYPLALQVACFHVVEERTNGGSLLTAMRKAAEEMRNYLPNG
jgi:AAA+ ATPase superfamily predicted ATPase